MRRFKQYVGVMIINLLLIIGLIHMAVICVVIAGPVYLYWRFYA